MRNEKITKELLNDNNSSQLHFFIISLFWRIPLTDNAVSDLISRAEIITKGNVTSDEVKKDQNWNKILRSKLYQETIDQCLEIKHAPDKNYYTQISEFEDDLFIIGDNPIVFEREMGKFTDFGTTDYCIAISSNRIFSHAFNPIPSFNKGDALIYNAIVIDQSKLYAASSNLKVLKDSIDIYKGMKVKNVTYELKRKIFKK